MANRAPADIDPHSDGAFRVQPTDRLASAGSCFAQVIAEALRAASYNYLVVEAGPPIFSAADRRTLGYGVYSARYGNVYTSLQLLQLLRRAFGRFTPSEPLWRNAEGRFVDPFRPSIAPQGFASESECLWDRESHLAAVRRMFTELDVFIFTLGLTECWLSAVDSAAFPVCPGSGLGGVFDPTRHMFHNFTVMEVTEHLDAFVRELREINPKARVILTVSPVPLVATFEPRHVLQATIYSKSVLRVACEEIRHRHQHVQYFAAYEIVTGTGHESGGFLADRRTVDPRAAQHVVDCFRRQFTTGAVPATAAASPQSPASASGPEMERPFCDEELVLAAMTASIANEAAHKP